MNRVPRSFPSGPRNNAIAGDCPSTMFCRLGPIRAGVIVASMVNASRPSRLRFRASDTRRKMGAGE
jgi:hypothetical protein